MRAHRFRLFALVATAGVMATLPARAVAQGPVVTFNEHVAPIVFDRCSSCHRPGESAPFSLLSFDDVRQRGRLVATVTGARRTPPGGGSENLACFRA